MRREKLQKQKENESLKKIEAKNRKIETLKQSRNNTKNSKKDAADEDI